ncbi:MAG: gamma carbonic anhydrase family protein [Rhizobiales bacterium 65-9]|nr:gamma carbonic anhydrase family protein [Hyphomicrobiales bacterium]OJY35857.1 MAG: gamma carbonic anhydrase family protein [Rhizobiales bacterium 65-9]
MSLYAVGRLIPTIADPARIYIAPGAHVMGQVVLGLDVSIWFGASLRADNEPIVVGDGTNIQEGCVLHVDPGFPLTIGRGATIGHKAILHGCTIGDGALIGMGATILNGARIGAGSLVGAGALVTEGKEFPERSLIIGAPARVARTLDDAAVEGLKRSAENYVRNGRRYAADLKEISLSEATRPAGSR